MIIPNKRWIVRNKKFHALGVFAAPRVCGGERVKSAWEKAHPNWRNPHVLSESKSWYRNRSCFFASMCCLSWKWKGVPEAGWICSHGRRLVDRAHLSQTAKHHNGKKGWWRKVVGGFSTFFESSLSAIGQGPLQQKTNGMIHHESLASPFMAHKESDF